MQSVRVQEFRYPENMTYIVVLAISYDIDHNAVSLHISCQERICDVWKLTNILKLVVSDSYQYTLVTTVS